MRDQEKRRYAFVAIDRATRWVYVQLIADKSTRLAERYNGRIAEVLRTRHFRSRDDLETTLKRYVWLYNQHLPQKAIRHRTPIQIMKDWQAHKPDFLEKLFVITRNLTAKQNLQPSIFFRRRSYSN